MSTPEPPIEQAGGDQRAERLVKRLLECLCEKLAEAGRAVCCCQWRRREKAQMPAACDCKCGGGEGVAWVRITERRFDRVTGGPAVQQSRGFDGKPCGVRFTEEWTLEIGVSRCWPEGENGLECDAETEASADGAWDDDLVMQALLCCKPLEPYSIIPIRLRTLGPQGGCIATLAEVVANPGRRPGFDYGYSG